jgi:hypothetical protein
MASPSICLCRAWAPVTGSWLALTRRSPDVARSAGNATFRARSSGMMTTWAQQMTSRANGDTLFPKYRSTRSRTRFPSQVSPAMGGRAIRPAGSVMAPTGRSTTRHDRPVERFSECWECVARIRKRTRPDRGCTMRSAADLFPLVNGCLAEGGAVAWDNPGLPMPLNDHPS